MRRGFRVLLVVLLVVAAAGVGWLAGTNIKSPAQAAAEAEPPEPSLIAVPVERTVISNDIITRGTARFDNPEPIAASTVVLPGVDPVLTYVPEVGDTIEEGDVLYEIAGRPTFALLGELPIFRTATRGDEGEDIIQLQSILNRLGHYDDDIDGKYGRSTERALVNLYRESGYEAYRPTGSSRYPLVKEEFAFFETLPLRVDTVGAKRGDLAAGEIMRVSGATLTIDSAVDAKNASFVSVGTEVIIDHVQLGIETTGVITEVAEQPGTNEVAADKIYVQITPTDFIQELNLANVRITIPVSSRSSQGEVLAVPAAALSATGTGETIVTVLNDDQSTLAVKVNTGLATASGLVEVSPVDGELDEGDLVVVGFEFRGR